MLGLRLKLRRYRPLLQSKDAWIKVTTAVLIITLVAFPSLLGLAAFLDVVGIEILLLCLRAQLLDYLRYQYSRVMRLLAYLNSIISSYDPAYFVPTGLCFLKYPQLVMHAVPGYLMMIVPLTENTKSE